MSVAGLIACGEALIIEHCQHCKKRPSAFLVKHPQTSIHWRCLRCFRSLVAESPCVVMGTKTARSCTAHWVDPVEAMRAVDLIGGSGNPRLPNRFPEPIDSNGDPES